MLKSKLYAERCVFMAVTIKDVAKLAGVSVATVSRAMNSSAKVSNFKKRKINAAIKALNYQPNVIAKRMVNQVLNNIAIFPSYPAENVMISPYVSRMLIGFQEVFRKNGMEILLSMECTDEGEVKKCTELIDAGMVRGIVLLSARVYDNTIIELAKRDFPFVVIGHPHPYSLPQGISVSSVDTDNVSDVKYAVSHLINNGHKRIALLHSPLGHMVNQERYDGYFYAHQNAQLEIDENLIFDAGYTYDEAVAASEKLLSMDELPTAVMATDDRKAVCFISTAHKKGLRVPEDISIIGHNNYEESKYCVPALTTVNVPLENLAITAAQMLINIINGTSAGHQRILLPTELIERDTVKNINNT